MYLRMRTRATSTAVLLAVLQTFALHSSAQQMVVSPDRANGVYGVGDTVHWTVEWRGISAPPACRYTLKSGGLTDSGHGDVVFNGSTATLDSHFESPGTMLLEVKWQPERFTNRAVGGAVAAPRLIKPAVGPPRDFESFWRARIEESDHTPLNPQLQPGESVRAGVTYAKITLDNIRGAHIQGQIARPVAGAKHPALLIVQWAGVYGLQPGWAIDRAAEGWLTLNIEAHDIPIDNPPAYYREQATGPLQNYWSIGNDDKDTSYFLKMYISGYRALEYLKTRDDWDGKTLVVMGDSQGGQQTLMLAGLHPKDLTAAIALVPAGCDMMAPEIGRAPAFPDWYYQVQGKDPKRVREAGLYYDVVNFARHIRCPVLVGLGLRDETCPPATLLAAVNGIRAKKEVVLLPKSGHQDEHGTQQPFNERRFKGWLPALREGKPIPVEKTAY
jgi:cephalosporin-C deacetylase-like acetyl esterase